VALFSGARCETFLGLLTISCMWIVSVRYSMYTSHKCWAVPVHRPSPWFGLACRPCPQQTMVALKDNREQQLNKEWTLFTQVWYANIWLDVEMKQGQTKIVSSPRMSQWHIFIVPVIAPHKLFMAHFHPFHHYSTHFYHLFLVASKEIICNTSNIALIYKILTYPCQFSLIPIFSHPFPIKTHVLSTKTRNQVAPSSKIYFLCLSGDTCFQILPLCSMVMHHTLRVHIVLWCHMHTGHTVESTMLTYVYIMFLCS
jgi:hypothetical protein